MKKIIFCFISCFFLVSCFEKETIEKNYPRVKTLEITFTNSGELFFVGSLNSKNTKVINHGFQVSEDKNFSTIDYEINLGETSNEGEFRYAATIARKKDTFYFVRAFAKTEEFLVLAEGIEFLSLTDVFPQINFVVPAEGVWRDTVKIIGKYFPNIQTLKIDQHRAQIVKSRKDTLWVTIPDSVQKKVNRVSFLYAGNTITKEEAITINNPVIQNVTEPSGKVKGIVRITGKNFAPKFTKVYVENQLISVDSFSPTKLKIILPINVIKNNPASLRISTGEEPLSTSSSITFTTPKILDVTPLHGNIDSKLVITGEFNDFLNNELTVLMNDQTLIYTRTSPNRIEVPLNNFSYYSPFNKRDNSISVKFGQLKIDYEEIFRFDKPIIVNTESFTIYPGDLIEILGKNLVPGRTRIRMNNTSYPLYLNFDKSESAIQAKISNIITKGDYTLRISILDNLLSDELIIAHQPLEQISSPSKFSSYFEYQFIVDEYIYMLDYHNNQYGVSKRSIVTSEVLEFFEIPETEPIDFEKPFVIENEIYLLRKLIQFNAEDPIQETKLLKYDKVNLAWIELGVAPIPNADLIISSFQNKAIFISNTYIFDECQLWLYDKNLNTWTNLPLIGPREKVRSLRLNERTFSKNKLNFAMSDSTGVIDLINNTYQKLGVFTETNPMMGEYEIEFIWDNKAYIAHQKKELYVFDFSENKLIGKVNLPQGKTNMIRIRDGEFIYEVNLPTGTQYFILNASDLKLQPIP